MTFIIGIFQFHGKIEQKQVKIKKIKWNMFKSDSFFPNLQSVRVFEWLLKFISW